MSPVHHDGEERSVAALHRSEEAADVVEHPFDAAAQHGRHGLGRALRVDDVDQRDRVTIWLGVVIGQTGFGERS